MSVVVEADFQNDLRIHFLAELAKLGVSAPAPADDPVRETCFAYFSVLQRLIPAGARTAWKSRELEQRILTDEQQARLATIVAEIEAGLDLRPRLSRRIMRANYSDRLLNDWGIHHLHVGPREDAYGPELLYVLMTARDAYLIDWKRHGDDCFGDAELMNILHRNWPDAIERFRAPGVVPGSLEPAGYSPSDRQKMRRHFTLCTQVEDGTVYVPLGGGTVACGGSALAARRVSYERQLAQNVYEAVRDNAEGLRDLIARRTGRRLDVLRFRYVVGGPIRVEELQTRLFVRLPEAPAE